MFRLWAKEWKNNRLIQDTVICNGNYNLSRTTMIFDALEEVCHQFDLESPIWLESNMEEFKRISKTRFTKDSFIESVDFDYLEIQVIEE